MFYPFKRIDSSSLRLFGAAVVMARIRVMSVPIVLGALLLSIAGCASWSRQTVEPPEPVVRIELKGPYDQEIPAAFMEELKAAGSRDDASVPYIFMGVGAHFERMGDDARGIHFYDRAAEAFRMRKNLYGEAAAVTRKVAALCEFGKMTEAAEVIRQMQQDMGTLPMRPFVDYAWGYYYLTVGDYGHALLRFHQAIEDNPLYRDQIDLFCLKRDTAYGAGKALVLSRYIHRIGIYNGWLEPERDAAVGDRQDIDRGMGHLRWVLELHEDMRRAEAVRFMKEETVSRIEVDIFNLLGLADGLMGRRQSAQANLGLSLSMSQRAGDPIGEAESLFFLTQIDLLRENTGGGLPAARLLSDLADKHHLRFYQVWAKYVLAHYDADSGRLSDAIALLQSASMILERPGWDQIIKGKSHYHFKGRLVSEALLDLLVRNGDHRSALETAERIKAKGLSELLAGKNIGANQAEDDLLREALHIAGDIGVIQKKMFRCADGRALAYLTEQMKKADSDYDAVLAKIRTANENLYALTFPPAVDSAAIQRLLDENTTLFVYFVTDARLYAWVMNKDRIHLEQLDTERQELQRLILSFVDAIKSDEKNKLRSLSAAIYDTLLKPVMMFASGDRVGVIPHDVLYYLPFAALNYRGKYLLEGFSIFYLPHLVELNHFVGKTTARGTKIVAFGNPVFGSDETDRLHGEMELKRIKKRFADAQIFIANEASIARLKETMEVSDIIHFAVPGRYEPDNPLNSGPALTSVGQDTGRLRVLDILKLRLSGRTIVWSASETLPDRQSTGMDMALLNKAFFHAGSPSVVSTLWSVHDRQRANIMDSFYASIGRKNDLAVALRSAQLDMVRRGHAPRHWAAFIVMGL